MLGTVEKNVFLRTIRGGDMTTLSSDSPKIVKIGSAITTTSYDVSGGASSSSAKDAGSAYSLVRVEQLDQTAASQQQRVNSWRYTGPDGLPYRTRATFETGFRVRLQELGGPWSLAHQQRGTQWFNAVQPGGDTELLEFQCWAASLLQRDFVHHPDDMQSWRSTFVDVEGGGRGKYLMSAADSTWRTLVVWVPLGREAASLAAAVQQQESANSDNADEADEDSDELEPERQLSVASFGPHLTRHEPVTEFARTWADC
jgi:hypothetical protein